MNKGAWQATVHRVPKSHKDTKQLTHSLDSGRLLQEPLPFSLPRPQSCQFCPGGLQKCLCFFALGVPGPLLLSAPDIPAPHPQIPHLFTLSPSTRPRGPLLTRGAGRSAGLGAQGLRGRRGGAGLGCQLVVRKAQAPQTLALGGGPTQPAE